jgi:hypothetical protein
MNRVLLALSWLCLTSSPGFAASTANVLIRFDHPKFFSDFRVYTLDQFETAKSFGAEISKALAPIVARKVPGGTLLLTFTDVDLTGLQKPWLAPKDKIRFLNDSHPYRIDFKYQLQDRSGRVVAEGATGITDAFYLGRYPNEVVLLPYDEFYFARIAMERWAKNNLNPAPTYTKR